MYRRLQACFGSWCKMEEKGKRKRKKKETPESIQVSMRMDGHWITITDNEISHEDCECLYLFS